MTRAVRNTVIVALALFAGSCVKPGHIQQAQPVRTLKFSGSHKAVAQCVEQRLGGKVQEEGFGQRYVIYGAAKARQDDGLTHYAITVYSTSANEGVAEWRIMKPPAYQGGGGTRPPQRLSDAAVRDYWRPVQECARGMGG